MPNYPLFELGQEAEWGQWYVVTTETAESLVDTFNMRNLGPLACGERSSVYAILKGTAGGILFCAFDPATPKEEIDGLVRALGGRKVDRFEPQVVMIERR